MCVWWWCVWGGATYLCCKPLPPATTTFTHIATAAAGIAATANWVANAAVAQTFLSLTLRLGASGAFRIYAVVAAAGFAWAWVFVPETAGLTLEAVQQLFAGEESADESPSGGGGGKSGVLGGLWVWRWQERGPKRRGSDDGREAAAEGGDGYTSGGGLRPPGGGGG